MNIVDLISNQLTGEVLGKLGGLVGASESQTRAASNAAVPALLQVFGKLAAAPGGAEQLSKAMGGLDLSMLGNLVGALGGSQGQSLGRSGGDLLGSLLGGGNTLSSLVGVIASFAGLQPGLMKTLLGYLAPIVLGVVAKQFSGRPDAAGVARLFSEQAGNISGAMPRGLSLGDLASAAVTTASRAAHGAAASGREEAAGLPGWLVPALVVGALGVGWYLWNNAQPKPEPRPVIVEERVQKQGPVTTTVTEVVEQQGRNVVDTITETIEIDPKFLAAGKAAGQLFTGLTKVLGGVKDEDTAKAALPELEKFAPLLATLQDETEKLPPDEKPAFAKLVGQNLGTLQKLIDTVLALPGVKDLLGPVVTPMVESLAKLAG